MIACGVWLAQRGLVAVLDDGAGRTRSCSVAFTDDARSGLALWLAAAGADLVIDETLLESDPIADVARRAGVTVWIAGPPLVGALRCAAGIARRGARPSAALLARLVGPHEGDLLSELHDAACVLPVYASQLGLPPHHATLGSGWSLAFAGRAHPAGSE